MQTEKNWLAVWTAAPMNVWAPDAPVSGFCRQTVRQFVRLSLGGERIRLRLSNEFGSDPVDIGEVAVARSERPPTVASGSSAAVTFGGSTSVRIFPGAAVLSDPVDLPADALETLAVSMYFPRFAGVQTHHFEAQQSAHISDIGNFLHASRMPVFLATTSRYLLSAVFVETDAPGRTIACFGDSITDGYASTVDADRRWPDILVERMRAEPAFDDVSVINQGLGGNRLLANGPRGASALARFDRDVLSYPNVSHVIILEGINDIGWPDTPFAPGIDMPSIEDLSAACAQLIERAKMRGIKVLIGTVLPFEGAFGEQPLATFHTTEKEQLRQQFNRWIRGSKRADAIIDFETVCADPVHPQRLKPEFDSGDHLHPNDSGYRALAVAVDLSLL